MGSTDAATAGTTPRNLSYVMFAGVVVIYLLIIQGGGLLLGRISGEDNFLTPRAVFFGMIIPLAVALAFTYVVAAYLGWLRPVLRDDRPTQTWVRVVPIVFIIAIALGIDYSALAEKGWVYIVVLLIATQLVGWGEEGMFRGIGVTTLRRHGLTEGRVALWSSVVFGAVHLSNVVGHGISALPQAIMVSLAGYFFYLIRRVSRSNAVNSTIHGLFDFSLLSGTAILVEQKSYVGTLLPILVYPVLAIILFVKRHDIEPTTTAAQSN
ncbi:CPBP family intramembrane glutamic endopeptidase [Nocardia sp. NPDC024068]|uniref:CPBP family intramembrane glutamic endopeptidase n=1 Tax=Nocardia sp. NPDC024068 TaxID=3157197 RepID=UPI0033EAD88D